MLKIIGLDESGRFESLSQKNRFIGGYTVIVNDKNEYEKLKEEIEDGIKDFCESFNAKHKLEQYIVYYPKSLHGSGNVFFKIDPGKRVDTRFSGLVVPTQCMDTADVTEIKRKPKNPADWKNILYYEDLLEQDCPSTAVQKYGDLDKIFKEELTQHTWELAKKHNMKIYMYAYPTSDIYEAGFDGSGQSNVMSVADGINLYERMATMAMYHELFYRFDENVEEYCLEFATRRIKDDEASQLQKEHMFDVYTQEADKGRNNGNNNAQNRASSWYEITNTSTYKTSVATKLFEDELLKNYTNKNYYFNVNSINYSGKGETTPFHYLADIVCSGLLSSARRVNYNGNWDSEKLKAMRDVFANTTGIKKSNISIRLYDKVDSLYVKMLNHINQVELDRFYEELYKFEILESPYKNFYRNNWIEKLGTNLSERLASKTKLDDMTFSDKVIGRLQEYFAYVDGMMGSREMECEKGAYIATQLLKLIPGLNIKNQDLYGKYMFRFNDVILRANNHRGDIVANKKIIGICEDYKNCVGLEEYIEHTLRVAQYYFNILDFEKVIDIFLPITMNRHFVKKLSVESGEETFTTKFSEINQLKRLYNEIFMCINQVNDMIAKGAANVAGETKRTMEQLLEIPNIKIPFIGKIYGTLSQAYGFLGRDGVIDHANAAIEEFADDHGNADINRCHLLHYYIEHDMKKYVDYAPQYFGAAKEDAESELAYQLSQITGDVKGFAIYVYTKAFNRFYANTKANANLLRQLYEVVVNISAEHKNVHPWELVYKNLYEAMLQMKDACYKDENGEDKLYFSKEDFNYVKEEALKSYKYAGATIQLIQLNFKLNSLDEEVSLAEEDVKLMKQFFDMSDGISLDAAKKLLQDKLTYEYV